jgi:hypothetical protein
MSYAVVSDSDGDLELLTTMSVYLESFGRFEEWWQHGTLFETEQELFNLSRHFSCCRTIYDGKLYHDTDN